MFNKVKNQKGVSLFLALVIMTIFLSMGLGLSLILMGQKEVIRGISYSVSAVGVADTGTEVMLYLNKKCTEAGCCSEPGCGDNELCKDDCSGLNTPYSTSSILDNGAEYEAAFSRNCGVSTIKSTGSYREVKRAFEINFGYSLAGKYLNEATGKDCYWICNNMDCDCEYIEAAVSSDDLYWYWDDVEELCKTSMPSPCETVMIKEDEHHCPDPTDPNDPITMWTYCHCIPFE